VTTAVWPGARLQVPNVRLVWPAVGFTVAVRVPVPPTVPIDAKVNPVGSVSEIWTPVAVSVAFAAFVTVIVNVAVPPRATDDVDVVFVTERLPLQPVTVTEAGELVEPDPAFVEVYPALLL
jgi:hypothetical protein